MSQKLKAKLSLVSVGLALHGHCIEMKVEKPELNNKISAEMDGFLDGLSMVKKAKIEQL